MARADRVAGEDGGEDALVLGVGDFPHLGVDEVVLHPAEHGLLWLRFHRCATLAARAALPQAAAMAL